MTISYETVTAQDEIDLLELMRSLWEGKWFILAMMIFFALAAVIYIAFKQPLYQAKIILSPPITADISSLNGGRTRQEDLKPMTPLEAYGVFRSVLVADSTLQLFIKNKRALLNLKSESLKSVVIKIDLLVPTVIASATSPQLASEAVKAFVSMTQEIALIKLKATLMKEAKTWTLKIKKEINNPANLANKEKHLIRLQNVLQKTELLKQKDINVDLARMDGGLTVSSAHLLHKKQVIFLAGIGGFLLGVFLLTLRQITMLKSD